MKKGLVKDYFYIVLGTVLMAVSYSFFMTPNGFVVGGVGGIGIILGHLTTASVGTWLTVLNIALLIVGFIFLGKSVGVRTVICTILFTGLVDLFEILLPMKAPMSSQPFLELCCAIFLMGIGQALVFNADATSGGTDIIAMIIKKHFHVNVGMALLLVDVVICILDFVFLGPESGLFSLLGVFALTFLIDSAIETLSSCKYFIIITDKPEEISTFILKDMDHGATLVHAEGVYTGGKKYMLHTVCKRREAVHLQKFVKSVDPNAFTIITTSSEIIGSGFRED